MSGHLAKLDHTHVWHPFTQHQLWNGAPPLLIERAEGCWLIDTEGNRYLDGVSSLWTNLHGHRHPKIDAAIAEQLTRVAHTTFLGLSHPKAVELAARLAALSPPGLTRVFFSDSGSTAAEIALKIAFQFHHQTGATNRTRFATLADAYHGDTLGAVSVGAIDLFHRIYRPLLFEPLVVPAPRTPNGEDERACEQAAIALLDQHGPDLAALIIEPLVQGAAGMKMHSPRFVRRLVAVARERGVLVIADEVAVGFGRTGTMFAMEQVDVAPDILCLAKGISGGYLPLAATITTERIFEAFVGAPEESRQFFHGHTYTANPLACAAALASLDIFEEEATLTHIRKAESWLADALATLRKQPGIAAVRHRGVMVGIDVRRPDGSAFEPASLVGHRIAMAARPLGAVLRPLGDTIVLNPPLVITHEELDQLVGITSAAIDTVLSEGA